jgi:mannan endo-1,6-alpha-mannosidase
MYLITGKQRHLDRARRIYQWIKNSGIISADFEVFDGVSVTESGCVISEAKHSYIAGTLSGALAWLYVATKNEAYLSDAAAIFRRAVVDFSVNSIWRDPCEPNCDLDKVSPKGTAIMGFQYLYMHTKDQALKNAIQTIMRTSAEAMLEKCIDFKCPNLWAGNQVGSIDFHTQLNSLNLMNALGVAFMDTSAKLTAPPIKTVTKEPNSTWRINYILLTLILLIY